MNNRSESEQMVASNMRTSRAGLDVIKAFEGFRPHYQQLPDGRWIIGYGHVRARKEGVRVSDREAEAILREYDLPPVERLVMDCVLAPLNQNEFDALVSLAFNIGGKPFARSDVVAFLNSGNRLAAASGFDGWRQSRIGGRVQILDALVRRRAAEKALFLKAPGSVRAASSRLYRPLQDRTGLLTPPDQVERLDQGVSTVDNDKPVSLVQAPPTSTYVSSKPSETPTQASEAVRQRIVKILGEDSTADGSPTGTGSGLIDRTSPEEITAAVSELVEDSEAKKPRKSVWPEQVIPVEKHVEPEPSENMPTIIDDLEPFEATDSKLINAHDLEPEELPEVTRAFGRKNGDVEKAETGTDQSKTSDPDWTYDPEVLPNEDQAFSLWDAVPYALLSLIGAGLFGYGFAEQNGIIASDATILSEYQVWMPLLMMLIGAMLFATMAYYTYRAILADD